MDFFAQYDAVLTDAEKTLVARAREFCAGDFARDVARSFADGVPFPEAWFARWAALGMLGLQVRPEHGGLGASYMCKIRVAQEMARVGFAAGFCMNHHQGSATRVSKEGSDRQRQELLADLMAGRTLSTIAMTEPQGGSDVAAITTTATPTRGGWLVNGSKAWLTNGMMVDCLMLLARTEGGAGDGMTTYIVRFPRGDSETVTREEILVPGARGFRFARITFRDHFVPEWAQFTALGAALKAAMGVINAARVHVAAMCVASLHAALCEAVAYCETRTAFGKPLTAHQGLRWGLAEVATRLEAANALVFKAALAIQTDGQPVTLAAQAKKFAVDTALWGLDQCVRVVGAAGASASLRLAMHQAEVRMAAYGDGTSEILLDRVGRGLAKDYSIGPKVS